MSETPAKAKPIPLSQVLADEYAALHGSQLELPPPAPEDASAEEAHKKETERLIKIYESIHQLIPKRTGLCFSGGGIRSATFGLGIIQGLARLNLLKELDYLSTVSGGGYIGSWLSAWIHWHPRGLAGVTEELAQDPRMPDRVEPKPVTHLRTFSNYLSPRLGLASVDFWTLLGTYFRNLLLNWLVLLPILLAGLLVPRLLIALVRWSPAELGLPDSVIGATFYAGLGLGMLSLLYLHLYRPSLKEFREPPPAPTKADAQRSATQSPSRWKVCEGQGGFLACCLTPFVGAVLLLSLSWAWFRNVPHSLDQLTLFSWNPPLSFALLAGGANTISWMVSLILLRRLSALSRWTLGEFATVAGSGALGGLAIWAVLKQIPKSISVSAYAEWYAAFGLPGFITMFLLVATLFVGLASRFTDDQDREWWGRSGSWELMVGSMWAGLSALVIFGPGLAALTPTLTASIGGVSGLVALLIGFGSKTSAGEESNEGRQAWIRNNMVTLAAPAFLLLFLVLCSLATDNILLWLASVQKISSLTLGPIGELMPPDPWHHTTVLHNTPFWLLFELALGLMVISMTMAAVIHTNKFSLHAMYRNRLIRAYLGASRLKEYGHERKPNLFTGFDRKDNPELCAMAPNGQLAQRPLHIVNMALNLAHGDNLAWQQRKAQSFTASSLHCGSWNLAYRSSSQYGRNRGVKRALSLGTALAISGAAASPNMGYHSSGAVTFLLTLFNVRLGWWLGNPGDAGAKTFDRSCPRWALRPLLAEAFGLTDARNPYVYLSDGGHFENLGLYEMVLRRCHIIIVSDAGCDRQSGFSDLGNAIRKIRIDLGIEIELDVEGLRQHKGGNQSECHHAIGAIRYDLADANASKGILIYLKPSLTGQEPTDILDYAGKHPDFPHETTADQFFDESQFESYRKLGTHIVDEVFHDTMSNPARDEDHLFEELRDRWTPSIG